MREWIEIYVDQFGDLVIGWHDPKGQLGAPNDPSSCSYIGQNIRGLVPGKVPPGYVLPTWLSGAISSLTLSHGWVK